MESILSALYNGEIMPLFCGLALFVFFDWFRNLDRAVPFFVILNIHG